MKRNFRKVSMEKLEGILYPPDTQLPFLNIQATRKRVLINPAHRSTLQQAGARLSAV